MTIALSALIIALVSLIWNVISTVHSWRTSMPLVDLALSNISSRGSQSFCVNVRNKGGSSIAITEISVWESWDKKKKSKSGYGIGPDSTKKDLTGVKGPRLPCTINGFHSRAWDFDVEWLGGQKSYHGKVLVEVELSTGKVVGEQFEVGDNRINS